MSQCQQQFAMSVACQSLTRGLGAVEGFYAGEVQLVGAKAISAVGQDIVPNSYVLWVASDAGAATFSVTLAPGELHAMLSDSLTSCGIFALRVSCG